MAAEHLSYSGINRSITDYAGSRACEELINLRPTSDGLMPVRPFNTIFSNKGFDRVFIHHAIGVDNYIGVRHDSSNLTVSLLSSGGSGLQTLVTIPLVGDSSSAKEAMAQRLIQNLHFATAGNIMLVSVCDQDDSVYGNWAFTWTGPLTRYKVTEANVPKIDYYASDNNTTVYKIQGIANLNRESGENDVINAVENGLNGVQETNPELCIGPIIIAIAFKTRDGNTFWTNNWILYDPAERVTLNTPPKLVSSDLNPNDPDYSAFFTKYGYGYSMFDLVSDPNGWIGAWSQTGVSKIKVYGTNVEVRLGGLSSTAGDANYWNKNTSMIKSVEVYASRPIPYLDTSSAYEGYKFKEWSHDTGDWMYMLLLARKEYEKMDLENQLLYHQASVPMEDLAELGSGEYYPVKLSFGGNVQVTNETLRVDAGATTRYGNVLSYNARFHYYDSVSKTQIGRPFALFEYSANELSATTYVIARYSDSEGEKMLCLDQWNVIYDEPAYLLIAPSINVKEIVIYSKIGSNYYWWKYRMTESKTYNFSFCNEGAYDDDSGSGVVTKYENVIGAGNVVQSVEQAEINVTEQYNPFVFRVEHSYLAPGRITDLVPQNFVVTDATYGREPLDVFTERGIYALIQGSGDILYAWFDPIDPMVAFGRAVPTEMGIFFLSGGALYLCAGHRVTLVSDALMAGPHKYVRSAGPTTNSVGAYAKIAGASGLVDVSDYVSAVDFETFAGSGRLSYNRFRQEVFVSNPSYSYTYVLSLKYRQWFKVSQRLWQDEPASVIVSRPGTTSGYVDVLSLENESSGSIKVHLQTRPFSMGYQYAHIHRALSMIRAKLSGTASDVAVLHLYGSDDLQNWTLLAYAKRSGSTTGSGDSIQDVPLYISQLRTPTAARSWRYYTICLTGQVPSAGDFQTDVGPFVVDYDAVVRRLG